MTDKRQQLTLFVPEAFSGTIELVRSQFNPLQHQLIAAHVTLCREDEITDIETILHNLQKESLTEITIHFGDIIRFQEGKGVLLPAINSDQSFKKLRQQILSGSIEQPRNHKAHITLMHPRNATCTDEIFEELQNFEFPKSITCDEICLIEQEIGKEWKILERFPLQ